MKILHTTDLHFNRDYFNWIAEQQKKYDVFVISGDLIDESLGIPIPKQIEWIRNWLKEFHKPIFICSGNHDIDDIDNQFWIEELDYPNCFVDNQIVTIDNLTFGVIPFVGADIERFADCDILISHLPPANSPTSLYQNREDWGDEELFSALQRGTISPKIIFSGHIHHPKSHLDKIGNTTISNCGVDGKGTGKIPNYYIWNSVDEVE